MVTARIDSELNKLRSFSPRKATPVALKVAIDGQDKSFLIDPATGKVKTPPPAYGWALDFDFRNLKKFFQGKGYAVEEVMGDIAPVLS